MEVRDWNDDAQRRYDLACIMRRANRDGDARDPGLADRAPEQVCIVCLTLLEDDIVPLRCEGRERYSCRELRVEDLSASRVPQDEPDAFRHIDLLQARANLIDVSSHDTRTDRQHIERGLECL